jgi:hypothetical protein
MFRNLLHEDEMDDSDGGRSQQKRLKIEVAIHDFEEPIRIGEYFRTICCNFFFSHGITSTLLLLAIAMLVKLNIQSLLFLFFFYRLYKIKYTPVRF